MHRRIFKHTSILQLLNDKLTNINLKWTLQFMMLEGNQYNRTVLNAKSQSEQKYKYDFKHTNLQFSHRSHAFP